jgi:hypothetical protein
MINDKADTDSRHGTLPGLGEQQLYISLMMLLKYCRDWIDTDRCQEGGLLYYTFEGLIYIKAGGDTAQLRLLESVRRENLPKLA